MLQIGIYGATGYTGYELVKILDRHPLARIAFATSTIHAGRFLSDLYPAGPTLPLVDPENARPDQVDVVFLCLPHGAAASTAVTSLEAGARVIDLSADFRLRDANVYAEWYGQAHPATHLLAEAVNGLTEFARVQLPGAHLVANPGCYPTSILLGLQPLLATSALSGQIIADSKSGVSGTGRTPKQHTHFVEVAGNLTPYSIGQSHRHWPEIVQGFGFWQGSPLDLIFSPHLLPVPRGILSTIYAPLRPGWTLDEVRALYNQAHASEPFVRLLPEGQLASLAHANHTNNCVIGLKLVENIGGSTAVITSAIDNLIKGAAGQAVQNMNVMFGLDEISGLG